MSREINKIIIHCSDTKDSGTVSWTAIEKYHKETMGWSDIGYHFGIEEVNWSDPNYKYVSIIGRPWYLPGAHCEGQNADSIGICFVGSYETEEPQNDRLIFGIKRVIIPVMKLFNLGIDNIFFHRDFSSHGKTCPGTQFSKAKFIGLLALEKL